jgi:hypothetical protein
MVMTLQACDHLLLDGARHAQLDSSAALFDVTAHGYRPVMQSTACVRGHVCEFELRGRARDQPAGGPAALIANWSAKARW